MTTINVNFAVERETKGAVRYQEVGADGQPVTIADGAKIGTLYIRKSALGGSVPNNIKVSIDIQ